MREITDHQVNDCNRGLKLIAADEPSNGGASHYYEVRHAHADPSKSFVAGLFFQKGPIKEAGVNGLTHELLIAVMIDRLRGFQDGPFRCLENDAAIECLQEAAEWLNKRTKARQDRGVEGTHEV